MEITPAILAHDEADMKAKLFHPGLRKVAKRFHIDVMNGTLVKNSCWAEPTVIGSWNNLPEIEIHLMTTDPMHHIVEWSTKVPTLKNIIIHTEAIRNPNVCIQLELMKIGVTLAVNPETPIEAWHDIPACPSELLIMGVKPGASGQELMREITLAKIRRARAMFPDIRIAVDGGVSKKSIQAIVEAGATRVIASSAIWSSPVPEEALEELLNCAIISP